MTPLEERRFLFITGKGGAGKTTVAAALATALAERDRRVLIAMTEAKERISSLFGVSPLGPEITEIAPNVSAVKIGPEAALREYGQMILKSRTLHNAVFDNKYVRSFLAAVPGLYQWAMLGKAWYHSTEELSDGRPRFDTVLFDAPATGHGLDMLRVPKVIVDVVPPGLLRRDAERAWKMFRDPAQSGVIIVALPEDMPATEAIELSMSIREELELPIARLVINAYLEPLFDEAERGVLLGDYNLTAGDPGDEGLSSAARRAITERVQQESVERLTREIDSPQVVLPRLLTDANSPEDVRVLARAFAESDLTR